MKTFTLEEIYSLLNNMEEHNLKEFMHAIQENQLDNDKIRELVSQRLTIDRVRLTFKHVDELKKETK
jgi:hypothetical protein